MAKWAQGFIAAVVLVFSLVALLGCGGGSGSQGLTKAEFVRKGDTICAKVQSERGEIVGRLDEASAHPSVAQQEAALLKFLDSYEKAAHEMGELASPAGEETKVKAVVAAMEKAAAQGKADLGTLLVNSNVAFGKPNSMATDYGLHTCSF